MGAAEILHGTERNLPANLAFVHGDRGEQSPGRRTARQIRWRLQEAAKHAVGRAGLVAVVAIFIVRAALIVFNAWDEARPRDDIVCIRDQQTVLRVEGVTAPGHAADVPGNHQCSLYTWRGENSFVAQLRDGLAASFAILWSGSPGFLGSKRVGG